MKSQQDLLLPLKAVFTLSRVKVKPRTERTYSSDSILMNGDVNVYSMSNSDRKSYICQIRLAALLLEKLR